MFRNGKQRTQERFTLDRPTRRTSNLNASTAEDTRSMRMFRLQSIDKLPKRDQ